MLARRAAGFTIATDSSLIVSYASYEEAWLGFLPFLKSLISERKVRSVCEVGGGANPMLPPDFLAEHRLTYTVLDESREELDKAPAGYDKLELDILAPRLPLADAFDLVFSRMVAEHMRDGALFHRNVRHLLRAGGTAFHYFPTIPAVPFIANKVVAGWFSERLLHLVQGQREKEGRHGKFPAFYRWCRGPVRGQIERLERLGYVVDRYVGFFGHSYYVRIAPLHRAQAAAARFLVRHPAPSLTTYAYVVMRKTSTGHAC
jgi:hypothetical protein